jgi:hypothetical protein
MTFRALPILAVAVVAGCPAKRESGGEVTLARARARIDELAAAAQGPVFAPPAMADALLPKGPALSACAPTRTDLGVLVDQGQVFAFDRALHRDAAVEACLTAALGKVEGNLLFVPATLPGGRPQRLRIDAGTTDAALEGLDPKTELSIVVARGAPEATVERLVGRLRDRGFEKLVLRVEE